MFDYLGSTLGVSKLAKGEGSSQRTETHTLHEETSTRVRACGPLSNRLKFRFFAETNSSADGGKVKLGPFQAAENLTGLDLLLANALVTG